MVEPQQNIADLLNDIGLDALGRLIQNQQLGVEHQGAADGQLLLLPARQVAAPPAQHLFQDRKEVKHHIRDRPPPVTPRRQADAQVFLNRQLGKDLAPLGHVTDTQPRPQLGRATRQLQVLKPQAARGGRQDAHDGLQQGGLAHPVTSHQAGARAGRNGEADIPQDVTLAVILVELLDVDHGCSRLRGSG